MVFFIFFLKKLFIKNLEFRYILRNNKGTNFNNMYLIWNLKFYMQRLKNKYLIVNKLKDYKICHYM